jgi:hypothetical protein
VRRLDMRKVKRFLHTCVFQNVQLRSGMFRNVQKCSSRRNCAKRSQPSPVTRTSRPCELLGSSFSRRACSARAREAQNDEAVPSDGFDCCPALRYLHFARWIAGRSAPVCPPLCTRLLHANFRTLSLTGKEPNPCCFVFVIRPWSAGHC